MLDLLKLIGALLAIYFGLLGILGANNVDPEGKVTRTGKLAIGAFLGFSLLGIAVMLGEALEKARDAEVANQRYAEATARDSANIRRSELLVERSSILVASIRREDSLTQFQIASLEEALDQQRHLFDLQSGVLRTSSRNLFPLYDEKSMDLDIVVHSTYPPARRFMDSLRAEAVAYIPTLVRGISDPASVGRGAEVRIGYASVIYEIDSDTSKALDERIRPQRFKIPAGLLPLSMDAFHIIPYITFHCCGFPRDNEATEMLTLGARPAYSDTVSPVIGNWGTGTMSKHLKNAFAAGRGEWTLPDLSNSTVVLRFRWPGDTTPYPAVAHLRVGVDVGLAFQRDLILGPDRWSVVTGDQGCDCFYATVRPQDLERYPGEFSGAPIQPMSDPRTRRRGQH